MKNKVLAKKAHLEKTSVGILKFSRSEKTLVPPRRLCTHIKDCLNDVLDMMKNL